MRFNNVCYASICDCVCWVTTSCACLWFLTSSLLVLQRNMFLSSLTALFRAWNRFSISTLCCVSLSEHIYTLPVFTLQHIPRYSLRIRCIVILKITGHSVLFFNNYWERIAVLDGLLKQSSVDNTWCVWTSCFLCLALFFLLSWFLFLFWLKLIMCYLYSLLLFTKCPSVRQKSLVTHNHSQWNRTCSPLRTWKAKKVLFSSLLSNISHLYTPSPSAPSFHTCRVV